MDISLKHIILKFKELCTSHPQVNSYYNDFIIDAYKSNKIEHTTVVTNVTNAVVNPTNITITIQLAVLDKVMKGNDNALEVESTTLQILGDIINHISTDATWDYARLSGTPTATKLVERTLDVCNGWMTTFQLKLNKANGTCLTPLIPIGCADSNYIVEYLNGTLIESGTIASGGTKTIQVPNPAGGTYEVTLTFDNNLITILSVDDDTSYNIDCNTPLDIAVVSGGQDGVYFPDGVYNGKTKYSDGIGNYIQFETDANNSFGVNIWVLWTPLTDVAATQNENDEFPYGVAWLGRTVTQGTISDYCGGGVCADATVENSNTTFQESIVSGDTLVLDDYEFEFQDENDNVLATEIRPAMVGETFILESYCPTEFSYNLNINGVFSQVVTVNINDDINITIN